MPPLLSINKSLLDEELVPPISLANKKSPYGTPVAKKKSDLAIPVIEPVTPSKVERVGKPPRHNKTVVAAPAKLPDASFKIKSKSEAKLIVLPSSHNSKLKKTELANKITVQMKSSQVV